MLSPRTLTGASFAAVLAAVGAVALWPPPHAAVQTIPDAEYAALLNAVPVRSCEERYTSVPWELSLSAARAKAAADRKPLLLWTMDGHPLGCG